MLVMMTMVNLRKCIEVFGFNNDDDDETKTAISLVTSTRYNVNGISYTFLQQMQSKAKQNIIYKGASEPRNMSMPPES